MKVVIVSDSLTRANNTTAYDVNDVISKTGTAGTMLYFPTGIFIDGGGVITNATLVSSQNATTKLEADLLLFSEAITLAADNAAFAPTDANMEKLIGVVSFTAAAGKAGNAGSAGAGNAFCIVSGLSITVPAKTYGVLVARNAYEPIGTEKLTVNLGVIENYVS